MGCFHESLWMAWFHFLWKTLSTQPWTFVISRIPFFFYFKSVWKCCDSSQNWLVWLIGLASIYLRKMGKYFEEISRTLGEWAITVALYCPKQLASTSWNFPFLSTSETCLIQFGKVLWYQTFGSSTWSLLNRCAWVDLLVESVYSQNFLVEFVY